MNGQLIALAQPGGGDPTGNTTEIVLDNTDATFTDTWPNSTSVTGYQGANYQYHNGSSAGPGTLGKSH